MLIKIIYLHAILNDECIVIINKLFNNVFQILISNF